MFLPHARVLDSRSDESFHGENALQNRASTALIAIEDATKMLQHSSDISRPMLATGVYFVRASFVFCVIPEPLLPSVSPTSKR